MNEILIYGDIGWENTARTVQDQLKDFDGEPVQVRINSGGGDVYEGIAILNALRGYSGEITTVVESIAASAASFIAVGAGARVVIRPNAELMIHRAWTFADGNSEDMARTIADLERQDQKIAGIYAERAGGMVDEWLDRMSSETWYTADEALDAGLVDEILDAKQPAAALASRTNPKVYAQYKYISRAAAPPPLARRSESVEKQSKKGDTVGILNQLAEELGKSPEDVAKALTGFFNETISVSGEVEVTYPADTPIAPTERVTIDAIVGEAANDTSNEEVAGDAENSIPKNAVNDASGLGLVFELGAVPDGYDASVDESTGVIKVKAPSGAEPGETVELTVKVNGTEIPATLKVRAVTEDEEEAVTDPADPPASPSGNQIDDSLVTVPRAHLEYLNQVAKNFGEAQAELDAKANEAKVDKDIEDGRFSAALRAKALDLLVKNPEAYAESWGSMPKGTINRGEAGYSKAKVKDQSTTGGRVEAPTREELIARANARASKKGNVNV